MALVSSTGAPITIPADYVWDFALYIKHMRERSLKAGSPTSSIIETLQDSWQELNWMHGCTLEQILAVKGGYTSARQEDFRALKSPDEKERYFDIATYSLQRFHHYGKDTWQYICHDLPVRACEVFGYSIDNSWTKERNVAKPTWFGAVMRSVEPTSTQVTYKCKFCGQPTDCSVDEDVLCPACRKVFGVTYYEEI